MLQVRLCWACVPKSVGHDFLSVAANKRYPLRCLILKDKKRDLIDSLSITLFAPTMAKFLSGSYVEPMSTSIYIY